MKHNEIPIYTGVIAGIAFTTYFFRISNSQLIVALILLSILGALVSKGLQFLLKRAISSLDNKSSILQTMNIAILPFSFFFLVVIISISVFKIDLTFQHLIWGLIFSFLGSMAILMINLKKLNENRKSIVRASISYLIVTVIALSIPSTLHWYLWNSSPCANGQCKIEKHSNH